MNIWQALILGVLQGATEFIPVSSSGHLVLVPWLLGWESPTLAFNAVLHLGTLAAVLIYFRQDCLALLQGWWQSLRERRIATLEAKLAWFILLGTIPGAAAGYLLEDFFESLFQAPPWVGFFLLITGAILASSEKLGRRTKELDAMRWPDALAVGLAQMLAIIPGVSRSGATIATGLGTGQKRPEAARFAFLLAIPIMLGAGLLKLRELLTADLSQASLWGLGIGTLAAALTGYACIAFLLSFLRRQKLYPFAIYCWCAGTLAMLIHWIR